jgi:hypothetical protein
MTEAEKQALAIYESICATSADRPFSANSVEEMMRALAGWREKNPAIAALKRAEPAVVLAFISEWFDWMKAESLVEKNFRVCHTLSEAIDLALSKAPRPLPPELVVQLLASYRQSLMSMAGAYFAFHRLLSMLTREQVTDEMRAELRNLHPHFAPSPTGKIEKSARETRERIAELTHVKGEQQLDAGRGPWSQIVFRQIGEMDQITRAVWEALLEHCRSLEQTTPGAKWSSKSRERIAVLSEAHAASTMIAWLALGPAPGQPAEARSPIEDSPYQKGVVWCLALADSREAALAIADFGIACLRKIRVLGAVSQKVGFACVQALGAMRCSEAVTQLTRLRARVKYSVARRLIEKSLQKAAERSGLSVQDLEDISVSHYGLDSDGIAQVVIGDARATVRLREDGRAAAAWHNADGKLVRSAPPHIKKAFPAEVRSVRSRAKELEQAHFAQRVRLESSFVAARTMPLAHWRKYFIEHPFLGLLGRRLIWVFRDKPGGERSGIWSESDRQVLDVSGKIVDLAAAENVRLWHPLSSEPAEVQRWRERVFASKIRQPFRQAFREFYQPTDDERATQMHSNRFAGIVMRQHQFASLCRARGWDYRLMSTNFDSSNVPTKKLDTWKICAEFYVDLPADRDSSLRDSALGEKSGAGIDVFIGSDQVRFYRDRAEIPVDDVPAIVYSEVMRDVDLFTSVCAVGDDETWYNQGDRGLGFFSERVELHKVSAIVALRADLLSRVLPHTPIADRCKVQKTWLEVRGQLGTYRIALAWDGAALVTDTGARWLKIPQTLLQAVRLELAEPPLELDYRTETILRKAHVLAHDWKIESPERIRQLMPE